MWKYSHDWSCQERLPHEVHTRLGSSIFFVLIAYDATKGNIHAVYSSDHFHNLDALKCSVGDTIGCRILTSANSKIDYGYVFFTMNESKVQLVETFEELYPTIRIIPKTIICSIYGGNTPVYEPKNASSWKYAPSFCTLLLDKSGEGVFARIFSLSRAYAPSLVVLSTHAQIWQSRWLPRLSERMPASMNVYYGKSAVLALILS